MIKISNKVNTLKTKKLQIKLFIYLIVPILIFMIPVEGIEASPVPCLSRLILQRECIGCGITRACINAIHFNFERAFAYNKLVIIVLPLCIYVYLYTIYKIYKKLKES